MQFLKFFDSESAKIAPNLVLKVGGGDRGSNPKGRVRPADEDCVALIANSITRDHCEEAEERSGEVQIITLLKRCLGWCT